MSIFLSELQEKEIISIATGLNYGRVVDVKLDENGNISAFIAEEKKVFKRGLQNDAITFKYSDIEKIGKDVILVKV